MRSSATSPPYFLISQRTPVRCHPPRRTMGGLIGSPEKLTGRLNQSTGVKGALAFIPDDIDAQDN